MKRLIRAFVDWMENGPAILTIWFIPELLMIALVALIINKFQSFNRKDIITK